MIAELTVEENGSITAEYSDDYDTIYLYKTYTTQEFREYLRKLSVVLAEAEDQEEFHKTHNFVGGKLV